MLNKLFFFTAFFLATITLFGAGYKRFEENGKVGIKDDQGHVVLPASFDALGWSDESFSLVGQITGYRQQGLWGLLNLKMEFITLAKYQTIIYAGGDRVVASQAINPYTTKYGCLDLKGDRVIPFIYDEIRIHEMRCIVMMKKGARYEHGLIDLNNRSILPIRYKRITALGSLRYAVQEFSGKSALCSEDGRWSTDFVIDSISHFLFDLAIIHQGWRQGIVDRNGEIKLEPVYREVQISGPGIVASRKADEWKMMDIRQQVLQRTEADDLFALTPGLARITIHGKSGIVNDKFNLLWPLEYDYIGPMIHGMAVVSKNRKYGLLREDQSVVIDLAFDSLIVHGNIVRARHQEQGKKVWDLYDTVGVRKTTTSYDWIGSTNGNFFPVRKNGFAGGVDRLGKERIACVYDSLLGANDEFCAVKFKGLYGIITKDDQWRVLPQKNPIQLLSGDRHLEMQGPLLIMKDLEGHILYFTDNFVAIYPNYLLERLRDGTQKEINYYGQILKRTSPTAVPAEQLFQESEGLRAIKHDGKFGFVDNRGRLRIANRYEAVGDFHDGLAPVRLLGKWGFINVSDQIVIQPTFDRIVGMWSGVIQVSRKEKSGLIDRAGNVLLELRYDSIQRLPDRNFLIAQNKLKGLARYDGKVLIEPRFDSLQKAGENHVIVRKNGRYGLLTLDGLSVFPMEYDQLIFSPDSGIFFARQRFEFETRNMK